MVLNETLRLYPPIPEFGRRIMKPGKKGFQLGSRTLPPGTAIVVESLYIQTRKDIWGDDADEFKPERFSDGIANACRHPFGFIPFGIGPRNCIGQHFAMLEARVILSLILAHFRFRLSPSYQHAPFKTITLRPRLGVQVLLEPV
jgi:cytochrome P450